MFVLINNAPYGNPLHGELQTPIFQIPAILLVINVLLNISEEWIYTTLVLQETLSQWRVVFYLASAVNLGCNLFYLMFASAEEEKWSIEESQRATDSGGTTPLLEESTMSAS